MVDCSDFNFVRKLKEFLISHNLLYSCGYIWFEILFRHSKSMTSSLSSMKYELMKYKFCLKVNIYYCT